MTLVGKLHTKMVFGRRVRVLAGMLAQRVPAGATPGRRGGVQPPYPRLTQEQDHALVDGLGVGVLTRDWVTYDGAEHKADAATRRQGDTA